jgi:hypothetical protein
MHAFPTLGLVATLLTGNLALAQGRPAAKRHYGPEYTRRTFHGTPEDSKTAEASGANP